MIRAFLLAIAFVPIAMAGPADENLPVGSAPQPIAFDHFPGRLHAVVWRNWQLVRPTILAPVLGTSEDRVRNWRRRWAFPPRETCPRTWPGGRISRCSADNWHLLPYEQLLPLIGMSRRGAGYSLREDDFLFIKLGYLKPRCSPVLYAEPDASAQARAAAIKAIVETCFGTAISRMESPGSRSSIASRVPRGVPAAPRDGR